MSGHPVESSSLRAPSRPRTRAARAAAASARPAAITGTLSKSGYTVIALGYDGSAVSSHARSFKLVPRSARVTLQLRDARGKYAGPVVVGVSRGKAVLGVKAGAKLGRIDVLAGFAKARKPVAAKFVDAKRTTARGATPAGNGRNFGLLRSKGHGRAGRGGDTDRDGVPNPFDIDADGDLILNPLERAAAKTPRAVAAQAQPPKLPGGPAQPQQQSFNNFSQLFLEIDRTSTPVRRRSPRPISTRPTRSTSRWCSSRSRRTLSSTAASSGCCRELRRTRSARATR